MRVALKSSVEIKSNRRHFLRGSIVWMGGLVAICPIVSLAQSINSQRDKPNTNQNPDNPKMNPSLNPQSPSSLGDPQNPLTKKPKRGNTQVYSEGYYGTSVYSTKDK